MARHTVAAAAAAAAAAVCSIRHSKVLAFDAAALVFVGNHTSKVVH